MNLPPETLFEILLRLSYDEIIKYCQINKEAYEICLSNAFWKIKAHNDFNISLSDVQGNTPSQRYRTLMHIFFSMPPIKYVFERGQYNLLPHFWISEKVAGEIKPKWVVNALQKGYTQFISVIQKLLRKYNNDSTEFWDEVFGTAVQTDAIDVLSQLRKVSGKSYIRAVSEIVDMWGAIRPQMLNLFIDEALAAGDTEFVNLVAEDVIRDQYTDVLQYLEQQYILDLPKLFQIALEDCPMAHYIYQKLTHN